MFNTAFIHRLRLPGGRPFHLLIASLAVSSCGDWLYNVALLALVYERTGSATWVSLTTAARVFPIVALGPLVGARAEFVPPARTDTAMPSVLGDIAAGARALRDAPTAVRLVAADLLCSAVYGLLTVTLVLVSHRIGAGTGGYGLLLGGFGAGG